MANRRPKRGHPGPNVLVEGDTGPRQPQGGARVREVFRESGDLESREFGVPQADVPGGKTHVVNPETHAERPPGVFERPADYHKYHGVESDDGPYELPDPSIGPSQHQVSPAHLHDAVPVYIVETADKGTTRRGMTADSILVTTLGSDPTRLLNRDERRTRALLLNEDASTNVRIGTRSELAENRGAMLPAVTNTYMRLETQDELWAATVSATLTARVSVIIETEVPD